MATNLRRTYMIAHLPDPVFPSTAYISCTSCIIASASVSFMSFSQLSRQNVLNHSTNVPGSAVSRGVKEMCSTLNPPPSSNCTVQKDMDRQTASLHVPKPAPLDNPPRKGRTMGQAYPRLDPSPSAPNEVHFAPLQSRESETFVLVRTLPPLELDNLIRTHRRHSNSHPFRRQICLGHRAAAPAWRFG